MIIDISALSPGGQMLVEELVDNGMASIKGEELSIGLDDFHSLEVGASLARG